LQNLFSLFPTTESKNCERLWPTGLRLGSVAGPLETQPSAIWVPNSVILR